jgi:hypothetical protein
MSAQGLRRTQASNIVGRVSFPPVSWRSSSDSVDAARYSSTGSTGGGKSLNAPTKSGHTIEDALKSSTAATYAFLAERRDAGMRG